MTRIDTIVAAATPPGRGSVGIVRVSGPKTPEIAAVILGELPPPRRASFVRFLDQRQQPIDAGMALFFPAPHSYTGEHVLELQGHGGPVVVESVVARVLELGARRAMPGEFTQRAFLNDKLDLTQAESIADLIDAAIDPDARGYFEEKRRLPSDVPTTLIFNKCDQAVGLPVADTITGPPRVMISALTGDGLDLLRAHLKHAMGFQMAESGTVSARQRHLDALSRARAHVEDAARQLNERRAGELVAEDLRAAQQALGEITGEFTTDDLLGRIFSSFCIGK